MVATTDAHPVEVEATAAGFLTGLNTVRFDAFASYESEGDGFADLKTPWGVKLLSGGKIAPHIDTHPSFHRGHRIHVPITTNPRVRFMIDGRPHQLQVGQAYEINNQKNHSVMNKGSEDRITFIFDYVPPGEIDRIMRRTGSPGAGPHGATTSPPDRSTPH